MKFERWLKNWDIHEDIIFGETTRPDALIEVSSHRRSNYHQINLTSLLIINPLYISYPEKLKRFSPANNPIEEHTPMVIALKDPQKRAAIIKLIETPAYQKYIGALGLVSISTNQLLWTHAIRITSVFFATLMIQMGPGTADTTSKAILYGALIKGVETVATTLFERMRIYTNDQEAVKLTEDPQSAKETLQLLDILDGPSFFGPSSRSRIEARGGLEQTVELTPVHLTENDYSKIDQKIMNAPEIKHLQKIVHALTFIARNAPFFLGNKLITMYAHGNKNIIGPIQSIVQTIFPTRLPALISPTAGLRKAEDDRVKQQAQTILKEMGALIPAPTVYYNDHQPTDYHVSGSPFITGESILVVPKDFESTSQKETFILRHEMSHLKHEDPLMKLGVTLVTGMAAYLIATAFLENDDTTSTLLTGFFVMVMQWVAVSAVSQKLEARADREAVSTAKNPEEIAEGKRVAMNAFQRHNREIRETHPLGELLVDWRGESRFDWDHPSLESRKKS